MKDMLWRAVQRAVFPVLTDADVVLAPRGDWPAFPCRVTYYDSVIEMEDATILLLHKGRLPAIRKNVLAGILAGWQCIYANLVFVVFARSRRKYIDARAGWRRIYFKRVHRYIRSRELRERLSTIYYVHLPKTGGTSMWAALSELFKSSVYYADMETFIANPPEPGEYDLVGLHFSPSVLEGILTEGDQVIGLLRHPTDRFISGILQSRREHEDEETFAPSQKAMRHRRLAEFLETNFGRYEARLQLIALGTDYRRPFDTYTDDGMLDNALAFLEREGTIFAPSHRSGLLMEQLSQRLNLRVPRLRRLNAAAPVERARYQNEFQEALPLIEMQNVHERKLYQAVCARFEATQAKP